MAESIAALETALARQRDRLAKLKSRRSKLAAQIEKVDNEIEALQGGKPAPRKKRKASRRTGTRRAGALPQLVPKVLEEAGEPLRVKEVAQKVLEAGYKTQSKDFQSVVGQFMYTSPLIQRAGRGKYTVKKGDAGQPQKAKGKKKTKKAAS